MYVTKSLNLKQFSIVTLAALIFCGLANTQANAGLFGKGSSKSNTKGISKNGKTKAPTATAPKVPRHGKRGNWFSRTWSSFKSGVSRSWVGRKWTSFTTWLGLRKNPNRELITEKGNRARAKRIHARAPSISTNSTHSSDSSTGPRPKFESVKQNVDRALSNRKADGPRVRFE